MKATKILFIISAVLILLSYAAGTAIIVFMFVNLPGGSMYIDGSDIAPLVSIMYGAIAFYATGLIIAGANIAVGIMWGVYGIVRLCKRA